MILFIYTIILIPDGLALKYHILLIFIIYLYCRYLTYVLICFIFHNTVVMCVPTYRYVQVQVVFRAQIERTKARAPNLNSKPHYREALQIILATKHPSAYILNPKGV